MSYQDRANRYSDLNRATRSLRQPGSAWKPLVYLAAFRSGVSLDSTVPDDPIAVPAGDEGNSLQWIQNYDDRFKGPIPVRQALAESRNTVAVWLTREVGLQNVIRTARGLGIHTPIQPYISTALGASEVRLLELTGVYRALASGLLAEPYSVATVTDAAGQVLYEASRATRDIRSAGFEHAQLLQIQEGLRGAVRLPNGTAGSLNGADFPIPVMGKTGTTSNFRDALFVGSTYGPTGVTVSVRIGFDDGRALGDRETGSRAALPIFREIMLRIYQQALTGPVPRFPQEIEDGTMTITLPGLILLIVIAALCGAVARSIAGEVRGGFVVSTALGFIGALLGPWIARQFHLSEPFMLHMAGQSFPILWSIIGASVFVAIIHLVSRR